MKVFSYITKTSTLIRTNEFQKLLSLEKIYITLWSIIWDWKVSVFSQ